MIPTAASRAGTDWRAFLLVLYNLLAAFFLLMAAAITGLTALARMVTAPTIQNTSALVLAGGCIGCAVLLMPGVYYGARRLRGLTETAGRHISLTALDWLVFLLGWPSILLISEFLLRQAYAQIIAPIFTVISVVLPVWFFLKLGLRGLPLESRLRSWGTFSTGLAVTPLIILIIEGLALVGLIIFGAIFIGLQPESFAFLQDLALQLERAQTEAQYIELLSPFLASPITALTLLLIFSVIAPVVEELLKTSVLWLIGRRIRNSAEGFALGVLCGAGYTIFETLGASSNGVEGWSVSMLTRFGADLIHIVNGGLMGWAIVSALQDKRYGRLLATLVTVIIIHALWNACTVFITLGALYLYLPGAPTWSLNAIAGGGGGLLALVIGNIIILVRSNHSLRASQPSPASSSVDQSAPAPE